MNRHSPSRNQRSKGIKIKQILQICLLVAICLWLIYQVKHSHDKKKEFEANDARNTINTRRGNEILKFGRKDLPQVEEETRTVIEKPDEEGEVEEEKEEENKIEEKDELEEDIKIEEKDEHDEDIKNEEKDETGEEIKNEEKDEQEEEIKNEEKDEQEEEIKTEEREDEDREIGNDGIDEHDEEKSEREEGVVDEEKETEEHEVREGETKDGEDNNKDVLTENEGSLVDRDRDEGNENTHEAREEQYKADDASSAVTHDAQITNENGNGEVNLLEQENKVNNTEEINLGQNGTLVEMENSPPGENGTPHTEEINLGQNGTLVEMENSPPGENGTSLVMGSTEVRELSNNSMEVGTEFHELNGTDTTLDITQSQNGTEGNTTIGERYNLQSITLEQGNNTNVVTDNNSQSYLNSTTKSSEESANVLTNSEFVVSENITSSNEYDEAEKKESSLPDESLDSNDKNEDVGQIQHDPVNSSDTSIPLEEKEMRTDLDTLPEIRTEGTNSEYAAAE